MLLAFLATWVSLTPSSNLPDSLSLAADARDVEVPEDNQCQWPETQPYQEPCSSVSTHGALAQM